MSYLTDQHVLPVLPDLPDLPDLLDLPDLFDLLDLPILPVLPDLPVGTVLHGAYKNNQIKKEKLKLIKIYQVTCI